MTTFGTTSGTDAIRSGATTRIGSARRVANRLVEIYKNWRNRRAFYRLGELSDAELQDIGLTRGDLSVAVSLGRDPTCHLGAIANARRDGREPFYINRF